MDQATQSFLNFLGGVALLLYGMRIAGEALQQVAGTRLRRVLGTMTGNRLKGAALGAGVTVLMQSSSATTVLLIGLVGAGLLSLRQTLGVLLGADLGTTVTVQLISFQIVDWAPLMIAIGVGLILSTRSGGGEAHRSVDLWLRAGVPGDRLSGGRFGGLGRERLV